MKPVHHYRPSRKAMLLVTATLAFMLFASGCGTESQELSTFLSRPLAEVSLGELLFCIFLVNMVTR